MNFCPFRITFARNKRKIFEPKGSMLDLKERVDNLKSNI